MVKKLLRGACIVVPVLLIDRLTKTWAMERAPHMEIIPDMVGARYAQNTGAAFSFLSDMPWLVFAISALLAAAIVALLLVDKSMNRGARLGLWLVAAGGLGNLYDRLAYGYVVDFLELLFMDFAIFNVADICVCCGAFLAAAALIFADVKSKKNAEGA